MKWTYREIIFPQAIVGWGWCEELFNNQMVLIRENWLHLPTRMKNLEILLEISVISTWRKSSENLAESLKNELTIGNASFPIHNRVNTFIAIEKAWQRLKGWKHHKQNEAICDIWDIWHTHEAGWRRQCHEIFTMFVHSWLALYALLSLVDDDDDDDGRYAI